MENKAVICPYCGCEAKLESTYKIYQKDFGMAYICANYPLCDSYVGVHKKTKEPLGRVADKELRFWKKKAHSAFDPLWKYKTHVLRQHYPYKRTRYKNQRALGYRWLAKQLKIPVEQCHIGMFDVDFCKNVVAICEPYLEKIKKSKNYASD